MNAAGNNRNKLALIGGGALLVVILLIAALLSAGSAPQPADPSAGQPEQKANSETNFAINENDQPVADEPNYDELLDVGLSMEQIDGLRYGLYQYAQPKAISVKNIEIVKDSATHTLPDQSANIAYHTYRFQVKLDDTHSVQVEMRTTGLYKIRVLLFDLSNSSQLYDSGDINTRSI